jgi:hypothetical protein
MTLFSSPHQGRLSHLVTYNKITSDIDFEQGKNEHKLLRVVTATAGRVLAGKEMQRTRPPGS